MKTKKALGNLKSSVNQLADAVDRFAGSIERLNAVSLPVAAHLRAN